MNVNIENLAPCKKLVRFEIDAKAVDETFDSVTKEFIKHASLPGFRPGKAPKDMILKKYEKDISEEAKKKLIGDAYREGIKDQKLDVVGYPDIEEIQFNRGQNLVFAATVETAPDFEVPEYRGLPAKREPAIVSEEDVERAIEALRNQKAVFEKTDREVRDGDYVVINYTGTSEGKPLTEIAPTAAGLTEKKNFWVQVRKDSFIPGFTEQLLGGKAGEKRTVNVDFPADFVTPQLQGKKGVYEVEIVEVKEKKLPELNEEFAKAFEAESIEKLREGVRRDLQNELNYRQKRSIRGQILQSLMEKVNFDLPDSMVQHETKNVVYDIVQENQRRGVSKDLIEQQKEEIYSAANQSAKGKVKISFLFRKIAEKEGIRVDENELHMRILGLAQAYQMPPQKLIKELQERNGMGEIYQQILHEKVIDFLHENAKIEDVPAGTLQGNPS